MRTTHGFQGQAAAANEVAPSTEPGPSSKRRPPSRARGTLKEEGDQTKNTQSRLITHWIRYLRSPLNEKRNLPANTQNQTQRPHPTATLRPVRPGTRRRSPQMRYRKRCKPQRDSGPSCTTPTVSRAGLDRRTRNRGRNRQQHHRDKQTMMTW
jgi:hypothetical protein